MKKVLALVLTTVMLAGSMILAGGCSGTDTKATTEGTTTGMGLFLRLP